MKTYHSYRLRKQWNVSWFSACLSVSLSQCVWTICFILLPHWLVAKVNTALRLCRRKGGKRSACPKTRWQVDVKCAFKSVSSMCAFFYPILIEITKKSAFDFSISLSGHWSVRLLVDKTWKHTLPDDNKASSIEDNGLFNAVCVCAEDPVQSCSFSFPVSLPVITATSMLSFCHFFYLKFTFFLFYLSNSFSFQRSTPIDRLFTVFPLLSLLHLQQQQE